MTGQVPQNAVVYAVSSFNDSPATDFLLLQTQHISTYVYMQKTDTKFSNLITTLKLDIYSYIERSINT